MFVIHLKNIVEMANKTQSRKQRVNPDSCQRKGKACSNQLTKICVKQKKSVKITRF